MAHGTVHGIAVMMAFGLFGCAGEPRVLPPRAPPSRTLPPVQLPAYPPPSRTGRLVLDTTDGPMHVDAKYDPTFVPPGGAPTMTRSGELCTTPCVVDLPVGRYRLFFSATEGVDAASGDSDDIEVREGLYVYRRAPGRYRTPSPTDQILPGVVVGVGVVAIIAGGMMAAGDQSNEAMGGLLVGAGIAGVIGGGVWGYDSSRATEQQGASVVFEPGR